MLPTNNNSVNSSISVAELAQAADNAKHNQNQLIASLGSDLLGKLASFLPDRDLGHFRQSCAMIEKKLPEHVKQGMRTRALGKDRAQAFSKYPRILSSFGGYQGLGSLPVWNGSLKTAADTLPAPVCFTEQEGWKGFVISYAELNVSDDKTVELVSGAASLSLNYTGTYGWNAHGTPTELSYPDLACSDGRPVLLCHPDKLNKPLLGRLFEDRVQRLFRQCMVGRLQSTLGYLSFNDVNDKLVPKEKDLATLDRDSLLTLEDKQVAGLQWYAGLHYLELPSRHEGVPDIVIYDPSKSREENWKRIQAAFPACAGLQLREKDGIA